MINRVKEKQTDNELKGENFVYYPKKMELDFDIETCKMKFSSNFKKSAKNTPKSHEGVVIGELYI